MSSVSRQLTFELARPPAPTFENFVPGPNAEAVDAVRRIAEQRGSDACIVVWGAAGAGKSHLLQAAVLAARERGQAARYFARPNEEVQAESADALIAVDRIDEADAGAQGRLFTLYNALRARGGKFLAAADRPPARLPVRDDLRTRLGWGLVFEIVPLSDADKQAALAAFARARGLDLSADAIAYLLVHGQRDMASLVQALIALDRHSLALKRPVTVPLIRDWLNAGADPEK